VARLLVVHHSPTDTVRRLTDAVVAGALKHFFDTIFLEAGGALSDDGSASPASGGRKPFGLWVHGRYDTTGAVRSVLSIVQALARSRVAAGSVPSGWALPRR